MAKTGADDEATAILCDVARRLHQNPVALTELVPLWEWFTELRVRAAAVGGWLSSAAAVAETLLATEQDMTVMHGDVHHWDVLDFGGKWRAIDPKGLRGERTFRREDRCRSRRPFLTTTAWANRPDRVCLSAMSKLQSVLTCPECGHRTEETMPTTACLYFHECAGCGKLLKPLPGDCCVFCSYGDTPCPPIQEARATGQAGCC